MNKEKEYTVKLSEAEVELLERIFNADVDIIRQWQEELDYILKQIKEDDQRIKKHLSNVYEGRT